MTVASFQGKIKSLDLRNAVASKKEDEDPQEIRVQGFRYFGCRVEGTWVSGLKV